MWIVLLSLLSSIIVSVIITATLMAVYVFEIGKFWEKNTNEFLDKQAHKVGDAAIDAIKEYIERQRV